MIFFTIRQILVKSSETDHPPGRGTCWRDHHQLVQTLDHQSRRRQSPPPPTTSTPAAVRFPMDDAIPGVTTATLTSSQWPSPAPLTRDSPSTRSTTGSPTTSHTLLRGEMPQLQQAGRTAFVTTCLCIRSFREFPTRVLVNHPGGLSTRILGPVDHQPR